MQKTFLFATIWILIFSCVLSAGSINNSGFESSEPGSGFDIPSGWHVENYCAVVSSFLPNDYAGDKSAWQIDTDTELTPYAGSKFALLSNGDSSVNYGRISQQIDVQAGDMITGAYFFGTCDYTPWDDYAEIRLVAESDSGLSDIILVHISVADVGNYGSTDGWVTFQSEAFTDFNCGTYTLECSVRDTADFQLESYFAVDALHIIPEPASVMLLLSGLCLLRRKK
ncbi:MAG: hypothetical protein LLF92_06550 [Planctomycetaceae bacterium]|nr:hypothetical protein [Planctomycetaceae bacterium]